MLQAPLGTEGKVVGRARTTTQEEDREGLGCWRPSGAQGHRAGQPEGGVEAADTGPKGVPQAVLGTEGKLLEARTARRYNEVDRGARRLATQERRVLHPLQKLLD